MAAAMAATPVRSEAAARGAAQATFGARAPPQAKAKAEAAVAAVSTMPLAQLFHPVSPPPKKTNR